jgi:hypothetical protein
LFGVRIAGNPVGSRIYTFDYCAGNNSVFAITLMQTMLAIFDALPEEITVKQVEKILPKYTVKPIDRDPTCWKELKRLAIELNQNLDSVYSKIERRMTIPTHIPTTCPWCNRKSAQIENGDHPRTGRFLLGSCSECDWLREYDRGEEYDAIETKEDLDPLVNRPDDRD